MSDQNSTTFPFTIHRKNKNKNTRSIRNLLLRVSRNEISTLPAVSANNAKSKNCNTYAQYIYIYVDS